MERKGEKWGWILGWAGSFLWILVLSVVWLFQGAVLFGLVGLVLSLLAATLIFLLTPWRHPRTLYWKLMLPLFLWMVLCVVWTFLRYRDQWEQAFSQPFTWFWLVFLLFPLGRMAGMTWER